MQSHYTNGSNTRWRMKGRGLGWLAGMRLLVEEWGQFGRCWGRFGGKRLMELARWLETLKTRFAGRLYRQRGRWVRPFSHVGMGGLAVIGLTLAPVLASGYSDWFGDDLEMTGGTTRGAVLAVSDEVETSTLKSVRPRDQVERYTVQPGDTISEIAKKFDVSTDTIRWQNDLKTIDSIKPGQEIEILPVSGVLHKVKKGETIYSIAKLYEAEPQAIVDFPFNSFINDETFAVAIGQELVVPEGIRPEVELWSPRSYVAKRTPDAGAVAASGQFVWPAGGTMTQRFAWYHKGVDIANRSGPGIVAADAGKVTVAGWPDKSGYGNRVMIDHGNGYVTLYAHLSQVHVAVGQTVRRGDVIGQMGSTGRSTGTHLHFEVRYNGSARNPLEYLK